MELSINGEVKSFDEGSLTIMQLLTAENIKSPEMVSVQLNGEFVGKSDFADVTLKNGDVVDFLYFMGGGE